jgi:diguanylate cyclase (GGDEF)-like protein
MAKVKNRWGIVTGILSIIFIAISIYIVLQFPPLSHKTLYKTIFPVLGILFSLISFLAGHLSYPRVHNLKVYMIGYLTGITSIAYFLLFRIPKRNEEAITILLILIFINLIALLFLPSYVKYRITKRITFILVAVESTIILITRFNSAGVEWVKHFARSDLFNSAAIIGPVWIIAVLLISAFKLKEEFHLGGIVSGCALIYFMIWITPTIFEKKYAVEAEKVFFVFVTLYLLIGILIHWFSRMEHRVSYDPLLQIFNRNFCSKIIEEQSNVKTAPPLAIAMIDIDHFKSVNDTYGHQTGDKVLYQVAQTILQEVIPDGIACRYGGEEIIVFFPNKKSKDILDSIENVRASIEETKIQIKKRKKLAVKVSCGISHRESTSQNIMDVIHTADKALYRAKKGGRNQIKTGKTSDSSTKKR